MDPQSIDKDDLSLINLNLETIVLRVEIAISYARERGGHYENRSVTLAGTMWCVGGNHDRSPESHVVDLQLFGMYRLRLLPSS